MARALVNKLLVWNNKEAYYIQAYICIDGLCLAISKYFPDTDLTLEAIAKYNQVFLNDVQNIENSWDANSSWLVKEDTINL